MLKLTEDEERNVGILTALYEELGHNPDLLEVLNEKFVELDGVQNKDEFSRCLIFFLLGRMFEQGLTKEKTN